MILDLFRVTGRVAVVTGAGRGLGAAAAVALAQAGRLDLGRDPGELVRAARADHHIRPGLGQRDRRGPARPRSRRPGSARWRSPPT